MTTYEELEALYGEEATRAAGHYPTHELIPNPSKRCYHAVTHELCGNATCVDTPSKRSDHASCYHEDADEEDIEKAAKAARDERSPLPSRAELDDEDIEAYFDEAREMETLPEITMPRTIDAQEQIVQMHEAQEIRRNERRAMRAIRRAAREVSA